MFCPNCGTQNEDSAAACQKCGFNLKGAAAPKFKGTMLMVNAPPTVPRPSTPSAGSAPVAAGAPAVPAIPSAPVAPGGFAPRPAGTGKPLMKATMIGVAPPSPGAVAPPAPQVPSPVAGPTPAGVVPTGPMAAPHVDAVNPLGGTMVATPAGMGSPAVPGYGVPAAPAGFPPFPHQPGVPEVGPGPAPAFSPAPAGFGAPPDALAAGFGATQASAYSPNDAPQAQPQAGGGWNAQGPGMAPGGYSPPQAAPVQGYGQSAPQPAYGNGPMQGYGGQTPSPAGGFSAPLPATPYGGAMVPGGQPGYPMSGAMTPHGPIGKMRNPVMVVVLTYVTCGLYGLLAMLSMLGELKAFRQRDDISPILFLLPILQLIELIKLPAKVLEAKRMAGVPNAQEPNVILYLFFWFYFMPADLNEVWQAAQARQGMGALPPAGM